MKTIFKAILAFAGSVSLIFAEKDPAAAPTGFIRMVNAISYGTGKVNLIIDGEDMRPQGYVVGDATGGIGMKAGSHKITIKREGVKEGTTTVQLDKDQTVSLIPFAELVPASDLVPKHYEIRILRLKQKQVDFSRMATFVSVSSLPEIKVELADENAKWATVFVKRLAISETPLNYSQGYAPAKVNGEAIKPLPIGGKGNYVVVLYDDDAGKLQSLYFRDYKFLSAD